MSIRSKFGELVVEIVGEIVRGMDEETILTTVKVIFFLCGVVAFIAGPLEPEEAK